MDIPDLVQRALGDEEIEAGVSLGDEDAVCLTPTRTLVYKGDGILSDENLQEFSHDVDRIAVSEGHRKTKFTLEYFDGTRSFTVPPNRDEKVLQLVLEGVLRVEGVLGDRESVVDVYRFSELTLIVTEGRIIKLIGEPVWHEDYEGYPFENVTGLEFERASVATSVVIEIDGRPQRVKVPNDTAPIVRQTIEKALFAYYDVSSLEELNRAVDDGSGGATADDDRDDIDFGSGIDPLVTDDDEITDPDGSLEDISTGAPDGDDPTDAGTAAGAGTASRGAEAGSSHGGANDPAAAEAGSPVDDQQQDRGPSETAGTSDSSPETEGDARSSATAADAGGANASTDAGDANGSAAESEDPNRPDTGSAGTTEPSGTSGSTGQPGSGGPGQATETSGSARTGGSAGTGESAETGGSAGADESAETADRTGAAGSEAAEPSGAGETSGADSAGTTGGTGPDESASPQSGGSTGGPPGQAPASEGVEPASREDLVVVADHMEELTEAVDRQNELLKRQHRAIKQLVDELQSE